MVQDQTKKEALFNEVKGSLFEYLIAHKVAMSSQAELKFIQSLDRNYLSVLSQQDRMVRLFYPEMASFLEEATQLATHSLIDYLKETPTSPQLLGKFHASGPATHFEADVLLQTSKGPQPLSLKLNKKNSFVNTKSGGIKSFFKQYFTFLEDTIQIEFNRLVDLEFTRMAFELHEVNGMQYPGNFSLWTHAQKSELPGELTLPEREILKKFYARLALKIHQILTNAVQTDKKSFESSLPALMGFSSQDILQLICFHEFKSHHPPAITIHSFADVEEALTKATLMPFGGIASVEISIGEFVLQIRVKPMNKFTTTAIKINCSVKFRPLA